VKLNQLRDLVAIVERGGLRAAARHLDVAQSALTRSIRELERELGCTLFERDARGMVLTPMGRLFHQRASSAMNDLQRGREELEQARGGTRGTVAVALSIMPHVGMLPGALPLFRQRFPGVVVKVIEGLYPTIEPGLRDGSIDFFLGAAPVGAIAPGLVSETVCQNQRLVVGRIGHPLAAVRSLKALAGAEWVTPSLTPNAAEDLEALFASFGLAPPKVMLQAHSAMSVMVALASTDLLAMLPQQWQEFPLTQGTLQVIRVRERLPAPHIVLVRRADVPLTPAADYFADMLRRFVVGKRA
jgi:LysR family transcriptional regulator of abg operon